MLIRDNVAFRVKNHSGTETGFNAKTGSLVGAGAVLHEPFYINIGNSGRAETNGFGVAGRSDRAGNAQCG